MKYTEVYISNIDINRPSITITPHEHTLELSADELAELINKLELNSAQQWNITVNYSFEAV